MTRPPRVLITGGTGLLGRYLLETAPEEAEVAATFHRNPPPQEGSGRFQPLDVRDGEAVEGLFRQLRPEWVIHTASVGSVDEAQRDPARVRAINVEGTRAVGEACLRHGSRLLYISSNAVFDGKHPPYKEEDPLCPLNRYGELKAEAEQWVRRSLPEALILRPILMYGWPLEGGRENAVTRWLKALEKGTPVQVSEETVSMPLWAADCARAVWTGLLRNKRGILHVGGADRVTMHEFAREVCRCFGQDERLLRPLPDGAFTHLAPRPKDTSFDLTRLRREFGIEPLGVREGLAQMRLQLVP